MRSCFPQFRKKFLLERRCQITDTFGTASSRLHAEHSFDHLDMVVSPGDDQFVMLDQKILHVIKFGKLFGRREHLHCCLHTVFIVLTARPFRPDQRPISIRSDGESNRFRSRSLFKFILLKAARSFRLWRPTKIPARETASTENRWQDSAYPEIRGIRPAPLIQECGSGSPRCARSRLHFAKNDLHERVVPDPSSRYRHRPRARSV